MIKSLVTGGAGFIGSNLVDRLISLGHDVICIDNEYADNEKFYWNKKARNFKLDITNYDEIESLFESVDFVFHLAAESRIGNAINNPLNTFEINILGTTNVLQCSRKYNIKRFISIPSEFDLISLRIVIGSGIAFLTAQLLDANIFHKLTIIFN